MPGSPVTITIGVEEEFQIIDPTTRELRSRAGQVVPIAERLVGDEVTHELFLAEIEVGTPVCHSLSEVRAEIKRLRRAVIAAATQDGDLIAASGTHPFSRWQDQELTPKPRYDAIMDVFQQHTREQLIFGCHVHAGIADREVAIQVMNRARRWLPVLLALSANSPFLLSNDTGFASYRTEMFGRFPTTGIPPFLTNRAEYDAVVADLVATGIIDDASKIYWDIRPSSKFATIEFRIADVAQSVDEAVLTAGLSRGLALHCQAEVLADVPCPADRPELLRAAKWLAARHGLADQLFDFTVHGLVPAAQVVHGLLALLRPTLEDLGDWDEIETLTRDLLQRGTGAQRQRVAYAQTGQFEDVVDAVVAETMQGLG